LYTEVKVNEKLAPMLPNFKYKPKDLVFIWKWFDYLVLDWLSEWNLKQIIFLEIKSWKSTLNKNEKQIKQTIENKKVKYEIYKQV
jgi:predicted Holliday junction resolvase-like endonuclease